MSEKKKQFVFIVSAILVLVGAILYISPIVWVYTPYIYAVGCAGVTLIYLTNSFKDKDLRVKRLQVFLVTSGLLLLVSSYFMFHHKQEWIICALVSAILQIYAAFSTPKSLTS